jgi:hypothetical protein
MEIKDVIGAILSDLASARNISDLHSRRLINYYRQDNLLKYFPVPRSEIRSVNIEMKFAVKVIEEDGTRSSTRQGKMSNVVEKYIFEVVNGISDAVVGLYDHNPQLEFLVETLSVAEERQHLMGLITEKVNHALKLDSSGEKYSVDQVMTWVGEVFHKRFTEEFSLTLKSDNMLFQGKNLKEVASIVSAEPVGMLLHEVAKVSQHPYDPKVELIFEAEKLRELPGEAISTLSIVSEIRNYNWQKVGEKENKPEFRLQPE